MKLFAVLVATLALLAGFAGGMRAYSAAAPAHAAPAPVAVPHHPKAQPVRPGPTFRWAPCAKPAVRQGRFCVTHVTHTVSVPAPVVAAPQAPVRVAAPAPRHPHPTAPPPTTHHDGGNHHGDDGGGGHDD
jgi:hypothetical protein